MALGAQKLSECMVSLGYIPKRTPPNFDQVFIGEVQSEFGPVKVRIEDICEELIPYPKAYIFELHIPLQDEHLLQLKMITPCD
ncbi:hypothetical protein AB835_07800 [Candidatus Endobugula sertula]|uniref:Uncharacterized protein n=1 Tax=Candidatus Endobugula sertula TaxID=62101 RepID=A0A1D2QQ91_9GAMM|nr:hypothetical protein AB835_07800 [Candidatus Endobugula sertula]